ncbi:MAG: hypothetical protein RQ743_11855 [Bacteroidales bacterium]|nr:hypothetical protein [Bacteroidales bacterium]
MKKNLTPLTGIVILFTIMIAGACTTTVNDDKKSEGTDSGTKGSTIVLSDPNVTIYLEDTLINGRKHLLMWDSNDKMNRVIDTLTTDVQAGDIVHWRTINGSIKKINNIRPVQEKGNIFQVEAQTDSLRAAFQLRIPDDASPGTEKYEIVFTDNDDKTWCIDPHLRIPDPEEREDPGDR